MNLKVNYEELMAIKKDGDIKSNELDKEINFWLEHLEILKNIWQGEDADIFYKRSKCYLERMRVITGCMNTIDSFIDKANNNYKEQEQNTKKELEKEARKNEQYFNK